MTRNGTIAAFLMIIVGCAWVDAGAAQQAPGNERSQWSRLTLGGLSFVSPGPMARANLPLPADLRAGVDGGLMTYEVWTGRSGRVELMLSVFSAAPGVELDFEGAVAGALQRLTAIPAVSGLTHTETDTTVAQMRARRLGGTFLLSARGTATRLEFEALTIDGGVRLWQILVLGPMGSGASAAAARIFPSVDAPN